jgi:hypothetical protein
VQAGLIPDPDEVRTIYGVRDTWTRDVVPMLKTLSAERWAKLGGCSVRTIKNLRNSHTQPSPGIRRRLERALAQLKAEAVSGPTSRRQRRRGR